MKSLRHSFQNQEEIGLEISGPVSRWKPQGIPSKINRKLVWIALGQFPNGILKEFLSKSIGNWFGFGELPVKLRQFHIDFKNLVWNAPGQFTCGNLREFLSKIHWKLAWKAPGQFTYGLLKESLSKSIGNWSGKLLVNFHMETQKKTIQTL